ncbi:MAG: T9SS type A sorting domain-containing protein [Ignavibacteriaceae bacterium]
MKKLITFLVFLLFSAASLAQTYLDVTPGYGTLNTAITANQGKVIYRLQAGQWYTLNAQIENSGFPLTIVGTTPNPGQMPAVIQTATLSDGTVLPVMINALGDVTLKNVFLVNADANNSVGSALIVEQSATQSKIVIDSVTCDPVGNNSSVSGCVFNFVNSPHPKLFITNSLFLRQGNLNGIDDGFLYGINGGQVDNGFDTLYLENNTFVSTGTGMGINAAFTADSENFVWINHNTFIFHKMSLNWMWQYTNFFVTNNLFFDFTVATDDDQPNKQGIKMLGDQAFTDTAACDSATLNTVLNGNFFSYISYKDSTFSQSLRGNDPTIHYIGYDTANGWNGSKSPVQISAGTSIGMKFTTDSSFVSVGVFCPSWADTTNRVTFKLYRWNTDYATTVAGTPIADSNFVNYSDNTFLTLNFHSQPVGTYYWELSNPSGTVGAWFFNNDQYNATSTSYQNIDRVSPRKLFVEYNSNYESPKLIALGDVWPLTHTKNNDGVTQLDTLIAEPLMYPNSYANVNQEAQQSSDKVHYPYFHEGNYLDNTMGANTDPQWTDPKFYAIEDSLVNWALPTMELGLWGFSATNVNPQPAQAGNWFWCQDTVYNYGNPEVWPRVNASYQNSTLLTASIEGLPLGDLNWFPAQKAIWQKNQAAIMTHILNENTYKIIVTSVKQENNQTPTNFSLSQNYPNPFNPSTEIKYSIPKSGIVTLKVYNLLGQEVATLVNQEQQSGNYLVNFNADKLASGVYMYRIQSGDFSLTKKMMLLK